MWCRQPYTEYISTRWYRAPECLLTDGYYGPEMDVWGAGCVMFEISCLFPLVPGENELDQIKRIHGVFGTPGPQVQATRPPLPRRHADTHRIMCMHCVWLCVWLCGWQIMSFFKGRKSAHVDFNSFTPQKGKGLRKMGPNLSDAALDLLTGMLQYDPRKRFTAAQALAHEYFAELRRVPEPAFAPAARKASTGSTSHRTKSESIGGGITMTTTGVGKSADLSDMAFGSELGDSKTESKKSEPGKKAHKHEARKDTKPKAKAKAAGGAGAAMKASTKSHKSTASTHASPRAGASDGSALSTTKRPPVTPLDTKKRGAGGSKAMESTAGSGGTGEHRADSPGATDAMDSPTSEALKRARKLKRQKEREARRAAAAAAAAAAEAAKAAEAVAVVEASARRVSPTKHLDSPPDSPPPEVPLDLSGSFPAAGSSGDFSNVKTGTHRGGGGGGGSKRHHKTHRSTDDSGGDTARRRREREEKKRSSKPHRHRRTTYDSDSDEFEDSKRSSALPAIGGATGSSVGADASLNASLPPIHGQSSTLHKSEAPVSDRSRHRHNQDVHGHGHGHAHTHGPRRDRSQSPTAGDHRHGRHNGFHATDPYTQYTNRSGHRHHGAHKHGHGGAAHGHNHGHGAGHGRSGHAAAGHNGHAPSSYRSPHASARQGGHTHRNRKYVPHQGSARHLGHGAAGGGHAPLVSLPPSVNGANAGGGYGAVKGHSTYRRRRNKNVRSRYATYFSDKPQRSHNPVVKKKPQLYGGGGGAGTRLVAISASHRTSGTHASYHRGYRL